MIICQPIYRLALVMDKFREIRSVVQYCNLADLGT